MKIAILYSGGLDSFLLKKLADIEYPDAKVKCVFYAHGQESEEAEIEALPDYVEVRRIDWLGENIRPVAKASDPYAGEIYIPGRNMVFCTLLASQELPDQIWMGTVADEDNEGATDKNEMFRDATSGLLSYVLSPFIDGVKIRFPFVELGYTKELAVRWALENGVTESEITSTVSCWEQRMSLPCGECKQCVKRFLTFGLNGISEQYLQQPAISTVSRELMMSYIKASINGEDMNHDERNMASMIFRYFENNSELWPEIEKYNEIQLGSKTL